MSGPAREQAWVDEVLRFWFSELSERQWFEKNVELDDRIRARFGAEHRRLLESGVSEVVGARETLASVIVLDQFSRNLFRGDKRAFAGDALARRLARNAIATGLDVGLATAQRMFLYMPFQHSEDRADQEISVRLFEALGNDAWRRYALAHERIIARFGRFPHRNAALGRESTPEEIAFLAEPGSSF